MQTEAGRTPAVDQPGDDARNRLLAELYREHSRALFHLLLGLLRDRTPAEEALQQVFLKLLESWDSVRLETAKGWLFTTAYHEAMARRRRNKVDETALNRLWATPVWQSGRERPDPAAAYDRRNDLQAVRDSLNDLPEVQREVLERRIFREQTFATIAQETGCPLNTVLSRMRLALEKLKRCLREST